MIEYNKYEIIKPQPTEQNPYLVDNYPYGFKKTNKRFWVETTKKGQRFIGQTQNPNNQIWNKPNKSTYSDITLVCRVKENGHIVNIGFSLSYSDEEDFNKFVDFLKENEYMSDYITEQFKVAQAVFKTRKHISFSIKSARFKHKISGEITKSVPIFDMSSYYEIDENDNEITEEMKKAEEQKKKETTQKIGMMYNHYLNNGEDLD